MLQAPLGMEKTMDTQTLEAELRQAQAQVRQAQQAKATATAVGSRELPPLDCLAGYSH
jgi:hypothetical protein